MPQNRTAPDRRSLAIFLPNLNGGGTERLQLDLAPHFLGAGFDVTFLLGAAEGSLLGQVPHAARIVSLRSRRQLGVLLPLMRYLKQERPSLLLVNTEHTAIISLWARALSRSSTRIIVCQHNSFSQQVRRPHWQFRVLPILFRLFLRWADSVIAVSAGVADDLSVRSGIPRNRIHVIYNGVVSGDFQEKYAAVPEHSWFDQGFPVVVAAGRMVEQKDFATLLRAFSEVAEVTQARLVLLGDGPLRTSLQELARSLGVADRVDMPGFCSNPLPYFRKAACVALSSRWEGFGMVLAEALACGAPVVSTDCPHGPAEILDHGRYGRLTPVGDVRAMSEAIISVLRTPPSRALMQSRGEIFTIRAAADRYIELFEILSPASAQ
jgi:glycosyltransferase involved in cell wall biosynthesis